MADPSEKNLDIMASALLEELGGSLKRRIRSSADELWSGRFDRLLTPLIEALFGHALIQAECSYIAVWLLDGDEECLIPVHIHGKAKALTSANHSPVNSGLLSLVCASGQSLCENGVQQNPYHNNILDTLGMEKASDAIVTPLQFAGRQRGVVSYVRTEDHSKSNGFNAANFKVANLMTNTVQRLIDHHLVESILGWD
ncbi:MAG: hypothetical protein AAGA96_11745 [Verrucomicrobiota bacterium]